MTIVLYGIPNCDTVKKARRWLTSKDLAYEFHDYKKHGIELDQLARWSQELGWESLLNRRGTTWRKLDDADKDNIDEPSALRLMQEHTSLIKRPVVEYDGKLLLGFDESRYAQELN